jgi:hypothetical protein
MRYLIALCAVAVLLGGCGQPASTPVPTVTPTVMPVPTATAVPTLTPLQLTAAAGRVKQQQTQVAQQEVACKATSDLYARNGHTFDRDHAARDPELALVELRIAVWGTAGRITSTIGQQMEYQYSRTLFQCLGLPFQP